MMKWENIVEDAIAWASYIARELYSFLMDTLNPTVIGGFIALICLGIVLRALNVGSKSPQADKKKDDEEKKKDSHHYQ